MTASVLIINKRSNESFMCLDLKPESSTHLDKGRNKQHKVSFRHVTCHGS